MAIISKDPISPYISSGLHPILEYRDLDFDSYIKITKNHIAHSRLDLSSSEKEFIINANSPFELVPEVNDDATPEVWENGILLVHGLLSSPFAMWDFGRYFQRKGFLVRSVLLPGHGTRPGDLLDVTLKDWIDAVEFGVNSFKGKVKNLYLLGYSSGAALNLLYLLTHKEKANIKGSLLFAPPLKLKSKRAFIIPYYRLFKPWIHKRKEEVYTSYYSLPSNGAYLAYQLALKVQKQLKLHPNFDLPVLMVLSDTDETIDSSYAKNVFRQQQNPNSKLIIYTTKIKAEADHRIEYRSSVYPGEKIIAYSHICMQISPENIYYGREGKYIDANYRKMLDDSFEWLKGATLKGNSSRSVQRLTYNPDFFNLTSSIDTFINKVGGT
jgi:esterase/lipase